jgi:diaminohydroxyphosphoribosylaminopyrimidine deaminase / 5-amino-6-(5-phosphoribosylamino)uracil reductase
MVMEEGIKYMARALRLAEKGSGWVRPNPLVGAVLVKAGKIIGEGYHEHFGGPHAEVNALAACTTDPSGATLYVTIEPCSHTGKTPPCVDLLIAKKIVKVVAGMTDPNPLVNGRGIAMLRNAGIEVETGVLEERVRRQNEPFIKYITSGLPFVVLKTAMTLDGKIATVTNASRWITGETSRKLVHKMRQKYAAVLVGIDTVVWDDPQLNVRLKIKNVRQPLKVILDSTLRISTGARVLMQEPQLALIATTEQADKKNIREIERTGAQVLICPDRNGKVDMAYLMKALGAMDIESVMIEGGSKVAFSALEEGIVDRITAFVSPKILGGEAAPTPVGGRGIERMEDSIGLMDLEVKKLGADILIDGRVKNRICSPGS